METVAETRVRPGTAPAFDLIVFAGCFAFLSAVSLVTHFTVQTWLGFALYLVPLLFIRLDGFRFMVLGLAGYLLFYEGNRPGSNFLFLNTPDSLVLAFIAARLFSSKGFFSFRLPISGGLIPLYAFILYGFALSVGPLMQFGTDMYVMRDIKNLCFLALVPLLCRGDEPLFGPRSIFLALCAVVALTSLHSMVSLLDFFLTGRRVVTWNEVFFADSVLIIPILLSMDLSKRTRRFLYACLAFCLLGLLAAQTRGLWISVVFALGVYAAARIAMSGRVPWRAVFKAVPVALLVLVAAEVIFRFATGNGLAGFIVTRLMERQTNELINPFSSLGYRIHESLTVWENRSWFGHGSGARLYIFFTQLGLSKYINWWSIHSEYFELLHKYGFIGLGLFMWFITAAMLRAFRLARRGSRFTSALGFIVLITLINHCLVSITSGYLIRENVMLYMVLMVGIVERYLPRADANAAARASSGIPAAPARGGAAA